MPHPTTFVPLGEPLYGVMRKAAFLVALDTWAKEPRKTFSFAEPPVDGLQDRFCDENAELAAIFFRLTRKDTLTEQMTLLAFDIIVHERRFELAWNAAHGERNPRHRASRDSWVQLKPYEAMINVLKDWAEALHDRACEVGP
ncbi:MAG: hypothetical protein P4M09_17100 [Devosia sp.]|nr:hypothetical protein [Devosia sp.]